MAKKARQRVSYVLENAKSSAGGHRLGVNGLAVDATNGILYSGGRDGIVCAWDFPLDDKHRNADTADTSSPHKPTPSKFRAHAQPHTNWINDIALAQNNSALVSASSDLTVKVWRPHSQEDSGRTVAIGEHADYVKCVATAPAHMNVNWVAAGGLDRKICLWDLNGAGKTLEIDVKGEDITEKGSVYALAVGQNIIGSGGPEKTVRLYDPRTGSKVSKLVGHLDNIRSILIDDSGDIILSASADKTIKMWSVRGGRCMYTFTMHDNSIWSLFSSDPKLGIFYSSDRSGFIAKTDVRGSMDDLDDGLSLAVAQESFGVPKVVAACGHIWTATERSSINRWADIDTDDIKLPAAFRHQRSTSIVSNKSRQTSSAKPSNQGSKGVPKESILRISNTAVFPPRDGANMANDNMARRGSEAITEQPDLQVQPLRQLPEDTIEGQFGLLKHKMLNDRRRVLTLDTAGDVLLWDLLACKPIQSFGKAHLEDVEVTVNTREAVAPWCNVDLSSGNLTVVLEPFNCFDAEIYADELKLDEPIEFREDQRISLGRWILRYLFAGIIDEEIKRDEAYRQTLNEEVAKRQALNRANAPKSIDIPPPGSEGWDKSLQVTTPKANGAQATPGLGIGLASPSAGISLQNVPEKAVSNPMSPVDKGIEKEEYFTSANETAVADSSEPKTSMENGNDKGKDKAAESGKGGGSTLGRKFRMSFSTKKLGRSASQATQEKPVVTEEKAEESETSSTNEKEVDDSFYGVIQKIRNDYDKQVAENPDKPVESRITPSLTNETPVLKLPAGTKIIIQEETSGGSANVYQGTVRDVGKDADVVEQKAPMWLGDVLLTNVIPIKDPVKISFVLHPMGDLLPLAPAEGNNRLNANRMLRVKKILAYVSERIEDLPEEPPADSLPPEQYLDLYCNEQRLDPLMSLTTIRTHVWKSGNDVVLYYKANGRKEIVPKPAPPVLPPAEAPETEAAAAGNGQTAAT